MTTGLLSSPLLETIQIYKARVVLPSLRLLLDNNLRLDLRPRMHLVSDSQTCLSEGVKGPTTPGTVSHPRLARPT